MNKYLCILKEFHIPVGHYVVEAENVEKAQDAPVHDAYLTARYGNYNQWAFSVEVAQLWPHAKFPGVLTDLKGEDDG